MKSWLMVQSPPTRTGILVRVGGLCIMSGDFQSPGSANRSPPDLKLAAK
ncbi:hypothetical protein [Chamaesiphon sp. GL140_3_metabinner_50]|nr:hypothetical protein [Chamaesiphon sp. GL140_3_metabinner_50]